MSAGDQAKNIGSNIANGNYGAANSGGLGGGLPMSQSGNDSTTTRATLTEGNITIGGKRTTAAETGINTDASKANEALATLPDVRKVLAEQQAMGAAAGTVLETSRQVAGDIAANAAQKTAEARDAYLKGLNSDEQEAFAKLDATAQQNVLLSQSTAYSDAYAKEKQWGTGGEYNRALQAVTTALVGGVSGQSGTQVASNALAPYAAQLIGQTFDANHGSDPNAAAQLLSHALLGAVLAEANGSSGAGGALAGAGGEAAAQYLTKTLYGADAKPSDLSEQDKQTILALSQAVGALVGGMTGGSLSDAVVGSSVARNAVENNWLKENENELKKVAQAECAAANKRSCEIVDAINELDKARDADYAINVDLANALMDEEGGKHTLQRFDQLMSDYWAANGVDPEDAIFASTVSRTFPTNGQKLYNALDKIPGGVPGMGIFGMMLPGILDQTGTTVAAWQDLYKPGQATNYFTGASVSGTSAFDERFLGAATVAEILLTSGASTVARTGLKEVAETAGGTGEKWVIRSVDGTATANVVADVSKGNAIDTAVLNGFPELPPGYGTLKSAGAGANETGQLPNGFRRIVNPDGETVIQGPAGEIYASEETLEALRSSAALGNAQSADEAVKLTFDKATRTWTTPAGLEYGQGSVHGNRIKHVLDHAVPNPNKTTHSVFNVDRKQVLGLIDQAWLTKGSPVPGDPGAYIVPMGRVVGTSGEQNIKIIVRPGTNKVITAYPVK
ncbi:VENN motif pre-toxin domain-containing protein [Xanthomonas sacchari]